MGDLSNAWIWDASEEKHHRQEYRNGQLTSVWRAASPHQSTSRFLRDTSEYGASYSALCGPEEESKDAMVHKPPYPSHVQYPSQYPTTYDQNQTYPSRRDVFWTNLGQPLQQGLQAHATNSEHNSNRQKHGYNISNQSPWSLDQDACLIPVSQPNTQPKQAQRASMQHPTGVGGPYGTQIDNIMVDDPAQLSGIREGVTFISGNLDAVQANGLLETGKMIDYQMRDPDFFHVGRVFAILFTEPYNGQTAKKDSMGRNLSDVMFGAEAFMHIRRFVVIEDKRGFCYGFPIATYGGRATAKPGVDSSCHAIIYTSYSPPHPVPGESCMLEPIRVITNAPGRSLDYRSRLNLSMRTAVQHNVKVKDYGVVDPIDLPRLCTYGKMEANNIFPRDTSRAHAAQFKHPSIQLYIPGVRVSSQWSAQDASWQTCRTPPVVHSKPTQWPAESGTYEGASNGKQRTMNETSDRRVTHDFHERFCYLNIQGIENTTAAWMQKALSHEKSQQQPEHEEALMFGRYQSEDMRGQHHFGQAASIPHRHDPSRQRGPKSEDRTRLTSHSSHSPSNPTRNKPTDEDYDKKPGNRTGNYKSPGNSTGFGSSKRRR